MALNNTQEELCRRRVNHLIPVRRKRGGNRPGITGFMDAPTGDIWKWVRDPEQYSPDEKKQVMAEVVRTMVMATFNNHYYKWDGSTKRQERGAAMDLRA